jgi:hypothetical protein
MVPPRTMPYLAALTPPHFDIQIIDEFVEDIPFAFDTDLVALTGMITHLPRAIDIARYFRTTGAKTIIDGPGVYKQVD